MIFDLFCCLTVTSFYVCSRVTAPLSVLAEIKTSNLSETSLLVVEKVNFINKHSKMMMTS